MKKVTPLPWKKTVADVTLAQKVRAIFFYVTTFVVAAPLFVLMLVLHPFVLLFDKHRRKAHHLVNKVTACHTWSKRGLEFFCLGKI
jgi:1-acyl-sn-glycerol-3-phosphate acyltransferase